MGRGAAVILLGAVLGALAGLGIFAAVYDNPDQYAQRYYDPNSSAYTYFVKGENVTQQRYDYFLATGSNLTSAASASVVVGLTVLAVFVASLWLRGRRVEPDASGVEEQIAAIVRDHPEAVREWGGPSVLREPYLVAEGACVLKIKAAADETYRAATVRERSSSRPLTVAARTDQISNGVPGWKLSKRMYCLM